MDRPRILPKMKKQGLREISNTYDRVPTPVASRQGVKRGTGGGLTRFGRRASKRPIKSPRLEPPRYVNHLSPFPTTGLKGMPENDTEESDVCSQDTCADSAEPSSTTRGWRSTCTLTSAATSLDVADSYSTDSADSCSADRQSADSYPSIELPRRQATESRGCIAEIPEVTELKTSAEDELPAARITRLSPDAQERHKNSTLLGADALDVADFTPLLNFSTIREESSPELMQLQQERTPHNKKSTHCPKPPSKRLGLKPKAIQLKSSTFLEKPYVLPATAQKIEESTIQRAEGAPDGLTVISDLNASGPARGKAVHFRADVAEEESGVERMQIPKSPYPVVGKLMNFPMKVASTPNKSARVSLEIEDSGISKVDGAPDGQTIISDFLSPRQPARQPARPAAGPKAVHFDASLAQEESGVEKKKIPKSPYPTVGKVVTFPQNKASTPRNSLEASPDNFFSVELSSVAEADLSAGELGGGGGGGGGGESRFVHSAEIAVLSDSSDPRTAEQEVSRAAAAGSAAGSPEAPPSVSLRREEPALVPPYVRESREESGGESEAAGRGQCQEESGEDLQATATLGRRPSQRNSRRNLKKTPARSHSDKSAKRVGEKSTAPRSHREAISGRSSSSERRYRASARNNVSKTKNAGQLGAVPECFLTLSSEEEEQEVHMVRQVRWPRDCLPPLDSVPQDILEED